MSVLIPPVYEVFWSALILLLLWFALGWAVPKIYGILDERQQKISEGLDASAKANADAVTAERERKEILRNAVAEAKGLRDNATVDAQRIVDEAREEASQEAARIIQAARSQIDAERQSAQVALRQDVGAIATDLAERIIGEQLRDSEVSSRVIDRFMDDLEANLNETTKVDA